MHTLQEALMPSPAPYAADAETSFDLVLDAHRRRLYGIAYTILGDHAEAEDALQDAMLKAWRSWSSVRNEGARAAWLTRLCVNHCLNRRRSRHRRGDSPPADAHQPAPADPRFGGRLVDLDRSYRRLSPKQRAAIVLHYHHGYSIDECAHLMKCRPGSVRTHLARAIGTMRQEMANA